jgi:sigma-B regulation protein RsbU (phosphoserine phosphatase)
MLMVQTAVRTLLSSQLIDSKDFINILNRTLYDNLQRMQSDKNLTLSLLDYTDGKLSFSGQHEEVLYVSQLGKVARIDTFALGFMVGVEPDIAQFVAQQEIQLAPGEGVVLYTDGVTEAMNEAMLWVRTIMQCGESTLVVKCVRNSTGSDQRFTTSYRYT